MGNPWRDLITEYCQRQILIGIHRHGQRNGLFSAGLVEGVEEDGFTLVFVDPNGFPGDGGNKKSWYTYNEIEWIDAGTPYLRGLEVLGNVFWTYADVKEADWVEDRQVIERELRGCMEAKEACRLRFYGEDGDDWVLVRSLEDDIATLTYLSEGGDVAGERIVRRKKIKAIMARGVSQLAMTHLARNQEQVPPFTPIIGA